MEQTFQFRVVGAAILLLPVPEEDDRGRLQQRTVAFDRRSQCLELRIALLSLLTDRGQRRLARLKRCHLEYLEQPERVCGLQEIATKRQRLTYARSFEKTVVTNQAI